MSLDADLHALRQSQSRELKECHARIAAVAGSIHHAPAQWIGDHPYIALAGAAAAGFIAAQLPARAAPHSVPSPPPPPHAAPAPAPLHSLFNADMLALLMGVAQQYFQPAPAAPSPEPSIAAANAGSIAGSSFPEPFSVRGPVKA